MFGRTTFSERPELVREWMGHFASVDLASIGTTLGALMRRDSVVDAIAGVDVPTLVVVGAEDRSLPPRLSGQIAERMPNASLVEIDGAGHLSALEQPEAVTDAMLGFLERLP
jgi:pimeloyl-ACP methyl ester carboxylesterase